MTPPAVSRGSGRVDPSESDLTRLFHRLNNQLGIILANAELLENRLIDEGQRARAGQLVASALDAISSAQRIRQITGANSLTPRVNTVESLTDGLRPRTAFPTPAQDDTES